ncbi:glycan-binding surface protein [Algoriphagus sp. 4150]|uniref:glycan-binding surface protein n=1 Tax=Algoriphagus sp. 4150 TaxID=2817756 RepID=UPI00286ABFA4|nr:glycan-binding surface protein [Algoriphagus sp. 4150]
MSKYINRLLLACAAVMMTLMFSCEQEDSVPAPLITSVRNYEAAPNDTLITEIVTGQWVVIHGKNLAQVAQVTFGGVQANINQTLLTDGNIVVQIPSIPFQSVPLEELSKVTVVSAGGSSTYSIDFVIDTPLITRVSYELPSEGDSVYIYGSNFFYVEEVTFAGATISEYRLSDNGTSIGFKTPALNQSGPVTVETGSGSYTTSLNVNDPTGMLCDFDGVNTYSWGANISNNSTIFPSNRGDFAVLENNGLNAGNSSWWEGGRSINTEAVQWVPEDKLEDPVDDYAFKFEINVPGQWNGTSLIILKDFNWDYVARYEPWNLGSNRTAPFTTKGNWITVTIPFSEFRNKPNGGKDGAGESVGSLKDLLGDSGSGSINIFSVNDSSEAAAPMNIAIDNIRVVKIAE